MSALTKEQAEALKFVEEAMELRAQQELRKAEMRKVEAEADRETAQAAIAAITRKERERVEELTACQDHYVFEHFFDGPVYEKSVFGCLNTMNAWHRLHPKSSWTITLNSPGGSVIDGMHLFDQITSYSKRGKGSHHITIIVRGYAASMAGILLQSADKRVIGPESYLMIHEVSSFAQGKIGELKDEIKFLERISSRVADIFVERSKGKITMENFEKGWNRTDWWLDSTEAKKLGFVDAIG